MIVSNGGQIIVTGGTGGLDVAGNITVGAQGDGSSMSVLNGADVYSEGLVIGGYDPDLDPLDEYFDAELDNGSGTVTVDGDGSVWDAEEVLVGFSGDGALNITNGGEVMNYFAAVGVAPDATGYVNVDSGSRWVTDVLTVGIWGSGTVDVLGGSRIYAEDVFIGGLPLDLLDKQYSADLTADGTGVVNVTGEGSLLDVGGIDTLHVGYSGEGDLDILDGGQVISVTSLIGSDFGSDGEVYVDDADWTNNGDLYVGKEGQGLLQTANGGQVITSGTAYVAFGTQSGGTARVSGEGSVWNVGESLFVGGHE